MAKDHLSRKLAVILHADVVGSTELVLKNETLAHERIQATFHKFSETIHSYGGMTRELRGDALVAEFERASDAVIAAIAFQQNNKKANQTLADELQPRLRIGISLGEVIVADNTITGAGVVLAQRLEQLSEPDGVVVQGSVSETVPVRMPIEFENLGKQALKGFDQPIRAFSATLKANENLPPAEGKALFATEKTDNSLSPASLSAESYEVLIGEKIALPAKPSIAVLPFISMSGDPEQEFFADGMSEDIITALSQIPDLVVISRSSTFVYKGLAVDVRQVGRDLAVGHVLEGSIRKVGDRLRITAQLVETQGGEHIWADRYDRNLSDIFAIQDEITLNIAIELSVKLVSGEVARTVAVGTKSIEAWKLVRRVGILVDADSRFNAETARKLIDKALELDSNYAAAWTLLGWLDWLAASRIWGSDREEALNKALESTQKALSVDPNFGSAYSLLGHIYMSLDDTKQAIAMGEKSIELAPSDAFTLAYHADRLIELGKLDEGIQRLKQAIRLCPFPPAWFLSCLGRGYHLKGLNEAAVFAEVNGPRGRIPVFSTHLNWKFEQSNIRQRQVTDLARFVDQKRPWTYPPIVCGDFNSEPGSDEIRMLTGLTNCPVEGLVFHDAWAVAGGNGSGLTWDNHNPYVVVEFEPDRRLDYIFVGWPGPGGAGHIVDCRLAGDNPVDGVWPSDHYAVVAELRY